MFVTIGTALAAMLGKEVSQKVAKAIGIGALALALVAAVLIGKMLYDDSLIDDYEQKREAAAAPAREAAADQRLRDQIENANNEEELHDAIATAPGGVLSPAARALACKRLRRYGRVPTACRLASGDGSQADPR